MILLSKPIVPKGEMWLISYLQFTPIIWTLSKFNTVVKPIIFDFYEYASMISIDVNIDQTSFEFIKKSS